MRVRDMFSYFCELCFACLVLTGLVWVVLVVVLISALLVGAWSVALWLAGAVVVYGGLLFLVAYGEARSHWKRGDLTS